MPLTKQGNFTFNHSDQPNDLYNVETSAQIKSNFDSRAQELADTMNAIIDQLKAITDGDSGADNIGATAITGLTGNTVQALLEALKTLTDGKANATDVFTKTVLQAITDSASGADQIGATPISTSPSTVQGILEWLKTQIDNITLGQIPDGSITDIKLSNTTGQIKQSVNNHLADEVSHVKYGVSTGTANTYAVSLDPVPTSYVEGMALSVKINIDATGASTLNVNGLGAIPIKKANGNDATNLKANGIYTLRFDGTNFILQGEGASGNATASDLLSGKTATTDAGEITGTLTLTGTATDADVLSGKTYYNTDAKTKRTGTMSPGKKFASGTVTSSTSQQAFYYINSAQGNMYYIVVSGLSFTPSVIQIQNASTASSDQTGSINKNLISPQYGQAEFILFGTGSAQYQITSPAYINNTGFKLPVGNSGATYNWYAYE